MKAIIVNVEKTDNVYVITYESGATRRYQELPKTAQAWMDAHQEAAQEDTQEVAQEDTQEVAQEDTQEVAQEDTQEVAQEDTRDAQEEPENAQIGQEDDQEEQEDAQDDPEEEDPEVVPEEAKVLPAPIGRGELAEIQAAELANIGNMVEIGNLLAGAADLLKNALVAVASVAPAVSDVAFQGLVAMVLALLFGFRGAAKAGKLAVRILPAVAGGVADFFIGAWYFLTGIPTWILGAYSWMRWEAFPVVAGVARGVTADLLQLVAAIRALVGALAGILASGWALRSEIIMEERVHA